MRHYTSRLRRFLGPATWVIVFVLATVAVIAPVHGQTGAAGAGEAVSARLESDRRTFTLTAPGLTGFRGGFSATVDIGGTQQVLSSGSGVLTGTDSSTTEDTPYGMAATSSSTIRFEKEGIELLFRMHRLTGAPVVMMQTGIRNFGSQPVHLINVASPAMDAKSAANSQPARQACSFQVSGNRKDWLVTGVPRVTPIANALSEISTPLKLHEYGGFYRRDGTGFLFGPVGTPVAYISARIEALGSGGVGLTLTSDMSRVRVLPAQTRWGQQGALFFEPPTTALARWAEWVAKTHGALTSKGALSGWSSWYLKRENATGKDVLAVANQAARSGGRLRPDVIQIDKGYEPLPEMKANPKYSEGLPFYARNIAATGARPGLRLELKGSFPQTLATVRRAVQDGFTYLKIIYHSGDSVFESDQTVFEACREDFYKIRNAAGEGVYILCSDLRPNRAVVGVADACRIGDVTFRNGVRAVMEQVLMSYQLNGRWFAVDNDCFYMATELKDVSPVVGGWPLARTWISMVGLSCGAAITSDPWTEEHFKPYWRNVEILAPPAKERTEVLDLFTNRELSHLVGRVTREWGDWTVALLWNPSEKEQAVNLDFSRIGLDPRRRYAVWSFWDNRYLGVAEGEWNTPFLAPSASQHLLFTELPRFSNKPVLIGSNLHIYCGAAEIKRVTSLESAMQIDLTDAGARDGDLYIYSQISPVVNSAAGCTIEGIRTAGENVWKLSLKNRRQGQVQRVELDIPLPLTRHRWFWLLCSLLAASLLFGGWRYVIWLRLQREHALEQERVRIARDIHDEVGAGLTKIGRLAAGLTDPAIAETTRCLVQSMDEIVWAVTPCNDTLNNMGNYLVHYTEEFLRPTGIQQEFDVPLTFPHIPLSADLRHNVFMVVKEALNNAVKHGAPRWVRLGLILEGALLKVAVEDDGCGFIPAEAATGADGLTNMRRRVAALGGQLSLQSEPGKGTTVTLHVPV